MSEKIRLLIVDDHPVVRKGLIAILATESDIELVGEALNGAEAVEKALALRPQVILMDLVMPGMDGIEATRQIKARAPEVNVLVLTSFGDNDKVMPSLYAGAMGYLLKDSSSTDLIKAIKQVAQGESWLHPSVTRQVLRQVSGTKEQEGLIDRLTERELDVLRYMMRGYSNQDIAQMLVVSVATVHSHVSRILSKLEVSSRTQAVIYAMRAGINASEDDSHWRGEKSARGE
ncbi:MAG TPA: response regulator transcription factor [Levilinea sp.]|nr:response regulator transcription factor [Levilinea sp.]